LYLGNLDAERDWGHAREYVEGMWRILQHDEPDDFILATGRAASVRDFCALVFGHLGMDYREHVEVDPRYQRPAEVQRLRGDASNAKKLLGWEANIGLEELARSMTDHDLDLAKREAHARTY